MESKGTETCPECRGTPQHVAVMCSPNGCRETIRACDFCGGLGIVEVEAADRYRRGWAMRKERVPSSGWRRSSTLASWVGFRRGNLTISNADAGICRRI
jgi:hypothetical protein